LTDLFSINSETMYCRKLFLLFKRMLSEWWFFKESTNFQVNSQRLSMVWKCSRSYRRHIQA